MKTGATIYNDQIIPKITGMDIMVRAASQGDVLNIAQVMWAMSVIELTYGGDYLDVDSPNFGSEMVRCRMDIIDSAIVHATQGVDTGDPDPLCVFTQATCDVDGEDVYFGDDTMAFTAPEPELVAMLTLGGWGDLFKPFYGKTYREVYDAAQDSPAALEFAVGLNTAFQTVIGTIFGVEAKRLYIEPGRTWGADKDWVDTSTNTTSPMSYSWETCISIDAVSNHGNGVSLFCGVWDTLNPCYNVDLVIEPDGLLYRLLMDI